MRARVLAAAAVGWLASAAAAAAQPAFPESMERAALLKWMKRETDITPESVIALSPQAVTSIVSTFPAGGGQGPRLVLRAEALSPTTYEHTGALSWHVSLSADCKGHRVRLGQTTGYPERNLLGERQMMRSADADWRRPEPGTALDNAWRSACEPGFKGPFDSGGMTVAKSDAPPSANAPPPAPAVARTSAPRSAAAPRPAARQSSAGGRANGAAVQVGASASEAEARALLTSLSGQVRGRETWVETATVAGRVWRRALVGGFTDGAEAARFCAALKAEGRACFVRTAR